MSDTVFRTKAEESKPEVLPKGRTPEATHIEDNIEVPYSDYEQEHGHPHSVDYFSLGDNWDVFGDEVSTIESYIKRQIDKGEIANSRKAVENKLKEMEKMNNLKNEERAVVKVGTLASYIKFLMETENIKRYGN